MKLKIQSFLFTFFNNIYFCKYQNVLELFCKKVALRNFAKLKRKHLYPSPSFKQFAKKETLTQMFSCEFCNISKNTFPYRTPSMAASNCMNS